MTEWTLAVPLLPDRPSMGRVGRDWRKASGWMDTLQLRDTRWLTIITIIIIMKIVSFAFRAKWWLKTGQERGVKGRPTARGGWLRGGCLSMWLSVGLSCDPKIESNWIVKAARRCGCLTVCLDGWSKEEAKVEDHTEEWNEDKEDSLFKCFFPLFLMRKWEYID